MQPARADLGDLPPATPLAGHQLPPLAQQPPQQQHTPQAQQQQQHYAGAQPSPAAAAETPAASASTGAPPQAGSAPSAAAAAAGDRVRMKHVLADNGVLNMGGGVVFQIPLWYDDLAKTGMVPRLEEVAVMPADLLRQSQGLQQNAVALADAARSRALLRGRYRSAGKDYAAAVPVLDSRQRLEQLQRLHLLQQQQEEAAAAATEGGQQQPPQQTQAAPDAVTSTLSAVLRHKLQPAPQYATPSGTVHWSVLQYREAVQQAEEAAAAAATAAAAANKKRSAAAAGLGDRPGLLWGAAGGSSSSKRFALADFGLSGSAAGEQWWYLPGTASEAEQARRSRRPVLADAAQQATWEDAALAAAWVNMVRKDIPRAARYAAAQRMGVLQEASRLADACVKDLKLKGARAARDAGRGAAASLKRLLRDGQAWWRAAGREAVGSARAAARAAVEAARREEEAREAKRQQQRLNFLLTQTELYSHFMKNKMGDGSTPPSAAKTAAGAAGRDGSASPFPAAAAAAGAAGFQQQGVVPSGLGLSGLPAGVKPLELADSEAEAAQLAAAAAAKAQAAARSTLGAAAAFDQEYAAGAAAVGAPLLDAGAAAAGGGVVGRVSGAGGEQEGDDVNLTQPSTMPEESGVVQPSGFRGTLKGYQLKGLQWLSSLYDQGLNGILADEMGLGKTVQALAFMAHLAEARGVWGPFLVVAPASTLHNWDRELQQFTPGFKVLPYWGTLADRKTLRRLLTPSRLYGRAAPFHVCLTSYQMAVADEAVLKKVKWQFMILDEAQAIKSSSSSRWRVLLSFGCRNRLLLSGTPIQNNLQELWALLHFIMPQLFDSREAFSEWFARGGAGPGGAASASGAGPNMSLDKHQLARLHAVLGPFMLRRVKADVVAEMVPKTEVTLRCALSRRQAQLYAALRKNLTLQDLVAMNSKMAAAAAAAGGAAAGAAAGATGAAGAAPVAASSSSAASARLMGLIMQMRKVCNHPELFEGQAERWPLQFADSSTAVEDALQPAAPVVLAGPGRPPKAPASSTWVQVTGFRSHIQVLLPRLLYSEGLLGLSPYVLGGHLGDKCQLWLQQRLFIFQAANTYSLAQQQQQQQQQADSVHRLKQKGAASVAAKQLHLQQCLAANGGGGQHQQPEHSQVPSSNGNPALKNSSSNSSGAAGVLVIPAEPCCYPSGLGFISLCGLSPSEVWAAAAGDPFQVWELSSGSSKAAAAAAEARQQRWRDYNISEQQWRQQVQGLRREVRQQQQPQQQQLEQLPPDEQQQVPFCPVLGQMRELHSTQHSAAQQQLLSLPPSRAALLGGRSRRTSRLLLLVDDIAAGHSSAAAAGLSSRGRGLRRPRAAWSTEDRQLLAQIQLQDEQEQQQQPAALGELLPPLVLSSGKRLRELAGLLRSVWSALIPPVLSPGVQLCCSSIGVVAQQKALVRAHWSRALLLGIDSRPEPPCFPAGAPPLLVAAASWRVAAAAAAVAPMREPPPPEATAATAATAATPAAGAAGDSSDDEGGDGAGRGSEAGDESAAAGFSHRFGAAGFSSPAGFGKGRSNPSPESRTTPPLPPPPSTGRGRGRGRRGRGRGRGRWAHRWALQEAAAAAAAGGGGATPSSSKVGDGGVGEEGGVEAGSVARQPLRPSKQYCYVLTRQQAALPGYCRDTPPPVADLEAAAAAGTAAGGGVGGGEDAAAAAAVADAMAFAAGLSTPSAAAAAAAAAAAQFQQHSLHFDAGAAAAAAAGGEDAEAQALAAAAAAAAATLQQQDMLMGMATPAAPAAAGGSVAQGDPSAAGAGATAQQQQHQAFPLVVRTQQPPISVPLPRPPPGMPQPPLGHEGFAAIAKQGLASCLFRVFGAAPPSQPYALAKALNDSGKLMALDGLLSKLKGEGHRCLIFCQMTSMMDLLEDYLSFRRHRYLRLDGSTPIAERRDLVDAWQGSDTYFVFLLSTRAGGLGINLTAADTVIFYESDWNPTMDLQAMDRAHRLGQTRPVTVYRLITAGTIEERIQSTAAAKTHVQRQVMAEETAAAGAATNEGAAAGGSGGAGGQGEEGEEEDGSAALLVPGSVPDGMLLDELEDEEAAAAAALGGGAAGGAGGAAGGGAGGAHAAAAGSGNRGLFVDDVPSALGAADVASLLLDDDLAEEAAKQGLNLKELASPQKPGSGSGTAAAGFSGQQRQQQQGLEGSQEGSGSQTLQQALGVRFLGAAGAGMGPAAAAAAAAMDAPLPAAGFIGGFGAGAQLPPLPPGAAAAAGAPATSFKRQRGMGRPPGVPGRGRGGRGSRGGRLGRPPGVPGRRGRGRRGRGAGVAAAEAAGDGWAG